MSHSIFLVAGGTGGHLFPAIATSENDPENNYIFLVDRRTKKYLKKTKGKYHIIISSKLQKNPVFFPLMLIRILFGIFQSIFLIIKYKPKLICIELIDHFNPNKKIIKKNKIYKFLIKKKYKLVWSGHFSHIFKS